MKTILFSLLALFFISCSIEHTPAIPEPEECNLGFFTEGNSNNVLFIRTTEADTIHFYWVNPNNQHISGLWITGVIDWDCIGFSMYDEPFEVIITANGETCVLIVPSLDH